MNTSTTTSPSMQRLTLSLGVFALFCTALLVWINKQTVAPIAQAQHEAMMLQFSEIIARDKFNNDAISDCIIQRDAEWLGVDRDMSIYRFRQDNEPRALLLQAVAPDGYNGEIALLIGIYVDGTLAGVRVSAHKETPGLGDKIERAKSDWIETFKSLSLQNRATEKWKVKKDGGDFDAFTGATITPRAVVKAVEKSLNFYLAHRDELFSLPTNCSSVQEPSS